MIEYQVEMTGKKMNSVTNIMAKNKEDAIEMAMEDVNKLARLQYPDLVEPKEDKFILVRIVS